MDLNNQCEGVNVEHISKKVENILEDKHGEDIILLNQRGSDSVDPEVGMEFYSEIEAYDFYNKYARRMGFSVRKAHVARRKDGTIQSRILCCNREGSREIHPTHVTKKPRPIERINCKACIVFKVDRNNIWRVHKLAVEHNHPLTSPDKAHLLRSHRRIEPLQKKWIEQFDKAGVGPSDAFEFVEIGSHGADKVGYTLKDHTNYLASRRMRDIAIKDAQYVLEILQEKQKDDPAFFWAIQLDHDGQIANFFWADGPSIADYSYFGDVLSFDTTFQTSRYDLPFAPFLGINHHKQTVVFGAALILDETTDSFVWLFKTFLIAMSGKQPKTIFTDQSAAMSKAIGMIFPNTSHRLCLWHIYQNAARHLAHIFSANSHFGQAFSGCIYFDGSIEDFEIKWGDMKVNFDIVENSWLNDLYAVREKWALVFRQESFCSTMTTTQRSENMNRHFKKYFNRRVTLVRFIEQYDRALRKFRKKELYQDFRCRQSDPVLLVPDMPMLVEASKAYTKFIYLDFENEFKSQFACICETLKVDGPVHYYKVTPPKKTSGFVEFNKDEHTVECSCMKFESMGILCMHSLKVLIYNNILHLPLQYILKRWTKYARDGPLTSNHMIEIDENGEESSSSRYTRLCQQAVSLAVKAADSKETAIMLEQELQILSIRLEKLLHQSPAQLSETTKESVVAEKMNDDFQHVGVVDTNVSGQVTIKPPASRLMKRNLKERAGRKKSVLEKRRRTKKNAKASASVTKCRGSIPQQSESSMASEDCSVMQHLSDEQTIGTQGSNTYLSHNTLSGFCNTSSVSAYEPASPLTSGTFGAYQYSSLPQVIPNQLCPTLPSTQSNPTPLFHLSSLFVGPQNLNINFDSQRVVAPNLIESHTHPFDEQRYPVEHTPTTL